MSIDLGFSGDLAALAAAAGAITKWVLYPLAQLRRRLDSNGDGHPDDDARGSFYVHPDMQGVLVLALLVLAGIIFAVVAREPLFPVLSAIASGWAGARVTHESIQAARSPR